MNFILTQPLSSVHNAISSVVVPDHDITNISGHTDFVIDSIHTIYRSIKWLITLTDTTNNKIRFFEINAIHRNGSNPSHIRFGDVGDNILIKTDVVMANNEMQLVVTNLEPNNINIILSAIRINSSM